MNQKYKILVVDDDLKNIQVGINFLKQNENYHLVFATSGKQALERINETSFDLILLDIIMPTMDGYEVCRQLKEDDKTRHLPVIFLTCKDEEESLMRGFELGGADYITKPFNAQELNARVKTHLELHRHYKLEIAKLQQALSYSQKSETIKYLVGGVAHDCNNFMMAIPANLAMLKTKLRANDQLTDDYDEILQGAAKASHHVTELLDQLFTFTSSDDVLGEVVNMEEVVADIIKVYKDYARHKITFDIDFQCKPIHIFAEKLHIEQVLLNLLLNAQHAILDRSKEKSDPGRIFMKIEVSSGACHKDLVDDKNYLDISIRDNGVGMTREVMEKVFDPYYTTRKDYGGTGLGLAVSLEIVQSYKGAIDVSSEMGSGTCFHIYFPCYDG